MIYNPVKICNCLFTNKYLNLNSDSNQYQYLGYSIRTVESRHSPITDPQSSGSKIIIKTVINRYVGNRSVKK